MMFIAFIAGFIVGSAVVLTASVLAFLTPEEAVRIIKGRK